MDLRLGATLLANLVICLEFRVLLLYYQLPATNQFGKWATDKSMILRGKVFLLLFLLKPLNVLSKILDGSESLSKMLQNPLKRQVTRLSNPLEACGRIATIYFHYLQYVTYLYSILTTKCQNVQLQINIYYQELKSVRYVTKKNFGVKLSNVSSTREF